MPRFFSHSTALGFVSGGLFGAGASNAVGFFTGSTIQSAATALTNGTCGVPVQVSAELACAFSNIYAEVVANSTTLRIGLCAGGVILGGLIGLLVQYPQEKISHSSGNSSPTTTVLEASRIVGSDTQQLILESDPEAAETTRLFHRPGK